MLENLRKKVTQLEAGIQIDAEKGRVRDPAKQAQILDAEEIRDKLQVGEERFFRFGLHRMRQIEVEHGAAIEVMREIKRAQDPKGILNPGKMLRMDPESAAAASDVPRGG